MSKVKCAVCGKEFGQLHRHLKSFHSMSADEYTHMYPNCSLVSDDIRNKISNNVKSSGRWDDNAKLSAQTRMKDLWNDEQYRDSQFKSRKLAEDREDVKVKRSNAAHARWSKDGEREKARDAFISMNENIEFTRNRLTSLAKSGTHGSKLQLEVRNYLEFLGISPLYEFKKYGLRLDIYIEKYDLCIEVGSEYHHGTRGQDPSTMTSLQYEGYLRDKERITIFGDKVLLLYGEDIYNGSYKNIINEFLRAHGVEVVVL